MIAPHVKLDSTVVKTRVSENAKRADSSEMEYIFIIPARKGLRPSEYPRMETGSAFSAHLSGVWAI